MSADWGPVIVAVALFILLSPGLLFQLPARTRVMEFDSMKGYLHLTGNSPNKSSKSAGGDVEIDSEDQDRRSPGESITNNTTPTRTGAQSAISDEKDMHDWAAPLIALALFAFLSPGLIPQFSRERISGGFHEHEDDSSFNFRPYHSLLSLSHPLSSRSQRPCLCLASAQNITLLC
ncbi:unnamed protein product [Brassica napus]|nr:unnamed protein product [Brassica napus]